MYQGITPNADRLGRNGDVYDGTAHAGTPSGCAAALHAHSNSMPVLRRPVVSHSRRAGMRVWRACCYTQGSGMNDFPLNSVRLIE